MKYSAHVWTRDERLEISPESSEEDADDLEPISPLPTDDAAILMFLPDDDDGKSVLLPSFSPLDNAWERKKIHQYPGVTNYHNRTNVRIMNKNPIVQQTKKFDKEGQMIVISRMSFTCQKE